MIPSTILGLAFFAACLGPGYVFIRVAERREARPKRSDLLEAVEMVVVGSLTSLLCATIVLTAGARWNLVDTRALAESPGTYLLTAPVSGLGSLGALGILSYGLAWGVARFLARGKEAAFRPGGNSWEQVFWEDRPSARHVAIVTVELRDGRKVVGRLRSFTAESGDNRELALGWPIAVQATTSSHLVQTADAFLTVRERDILYISGRYCLPDSEGSQGNGTVPRALLRPEVPSTAPG